MDSIAELVVHCRVTNRYGNRCTAEALDPNADVLICMRHTALVIELLAKKGLSATRALGVAAVLVAERELLAKERELLAGERAKLSAVRSTPHEVGAHR